MVTKIAFKGTKICHVAKYQKYFCATNFSQTSHLFPRISPHIARVGFSYHLILWSGFEPTSVELHLQQGTFIQDALPPELPRLGQAFKDSLTLSASFQSACQEETVSKYETASQKFGLGWWPVDDLMLMIQLSYPFKNIKVNSFSFSSAI